MPSIFLLTGEKALVEMCEQPYESEDLLQTLLADHPSVLAGDQFEGTETKRWLLICREAGVPGEDGGLDRWSLDHLFVDQGAIPTLVEVKRSTDTRLRREVIGQMLDYAANATVYWPDGQVRSRYENKCESNEVDPYEEVAGFLRVDRSVDSNNGTIDRFWADVDTNLRAGRIRLVFVADTIPPELRRIIEFLNEQMNPAEVLGIEIRQFAGSGIKTLVPTVIGQTARAEASRNPTARAVKQWDRPTFFESLIERKGEESACLAEKLLAKCQSFLPLEYWGKGSKDGSCSRGLAHNGISQYPFSIWTYGSVQIQFEYLKRYAPFDSETKRMELLRRLNEVPGLNLEKDSITRRPNFNVMLLANPEALARFCDALEWAATEIKRT